MRRKPSIWGAAVRPARRRGGMVTEDDAPGSKHDRTRDADDRTEPSQPVQTRRLSPETTAVPKAVGVVPAVAEVGREACLVRHDPALFLLGARDGGRSSGSRPGPLGSSGRDGRVRRVHNRG